MMHYSTTMACILSQQLHIAAPALAELVGKGELNANRLRAHLSQGSRNFSTGLISDMGRSGTDHV